MATRRDKGDGTIYFNNAAQKWFASYPIGRYEGGRTKYRTFTGDTEMEVRRKMKSFKKTQNEISANAKSKWTLKRYMEYWLETYKKVEIKTSTYSRYYSTAERNIYPEIGHIQMMSLTSDHIQQLINDKVSLGLSFSSIKKVHDLLNPCLAEATARDVIKKNPMLLVKMPKEKQIRRERASVAERYFRPDEKDRLIQACKATYRSGRPMFSYGYAYILMLYTGMRPGEMLALSKEDIDLDNKTIPINKTMIEYEIRNENTGDISRKIEIQYAEV